MDRHSVLISPQAYRDIDEIYDYIYNELHSKKAALELALELEEAILSLDRMPERGAERRVGKYANQAYRQLFVKNYIIVYRVNTESKTVVVITIKYSHSSF